MEMFVKHSAVNRKVMNRSRCQMVTIRAMQARVQAWSFLFSFDRAEINLV